MKTTTTSEASLIAEAKTHFEATQSALRKGCEHALLVGLRLIVLQSLTSSQGCRNDRTSCHGAVSRKGFKAALDEIGIAERVSYKWMNACAAALVYSGLVADKPEIIEILPASGSDAWLKWEAALVQVSKGMSINRLILGYAKEGTEDERYDVLISKLEAGEDVEKYLEELAKNGEWTLVRAIRAATGGVATKGKHRADPVYLAFNDNKEIAFGLIPKAFTTLENGFSQWDSYDVAARMEMKEKWKTVFRAAPKELKEALTL